MTYIWNHQPAIPLTPELERKVQQGLHEIERRIAAKRLAEAYATIASARASHVLEIAR